MSLDAKEREVLRRLVAWESRFKIVSTWPESRELQAIVDDEP
jgi:hypothetical protein